VVTAPEETEDSMKLWQLEHGIDSDIRTLVRHLLRCHEQGALDGDGAVDSGLKELADLPDFEQVDKRDQRERR
jgi:hypothetical protein